MNERSTWMAVLARASASEIESLAGPLPGYELLRGPEHGLTMVRGRAGGDGEPFNLAEATLTRCSVTLPDGTIGHCWRLGRDARAAELAAALDALLQGGEAAEGHRRVVAPLRRMQDEIAARELRRAAATAVQFATLAAMR
jgi:alpha-D-ribose 1-methylphosphonate 5-triphosphate synthase subunit PhnG